ncbi:hypothetical protein [Pararobbsia alpina]|uniref:Uncharacterized protein n=1 Tax=Pararobbsia alpina TaxID=621374 RepID=A0A6S7BMI3_9BURK|nr:hypothetical protein [Pararobbsia alpina]CAB3805935.1 hypothetical protein LMG28138_05732 [Pararobbsia alpina]
MQTWLALLGAPTVLLATLTANYALVPYACAWRNGAPLGWVSTAALLFSVAVTLLALRRWLGTTPRFDPENDALPARPVFLALVATTVGALSSFVLLAMWLPQWVIDPCR